MDKPTCGECRFCVSRTGGDSNECRRHAPSTPGPGLRPSQWSQDWSVWPVVLDHDWCGEFEAKPEPATPEPDPAVLPPKPRCVNCGYHGKSDKPNDTISGEPPVCGLCRKAWMHDRPGEPLETLLRERGLIEAEPINHGLPPEYIGRLKAEYPPSPDYQLFVVEGDLEPEPSPEPDLSTFTVDA